MDLSRPGTGRGLVVLAVLLLVLLAAAWWAELISPAFGQAIIAFIAVAAVVFAVLGVVVRETIAERLAGGPSLALPRPVAIRVLVILAVVGTLALLGLLVVAEPGHMRPMFAP
jgi:hypothetical protein